MYIHLSNPESYLYDVIDLNTGIRIPGVQEANDETGDFSIVLKDGFDNTWIADDKGELIAFHFKGNIKLIKKETK